MMAISDYSKIRQAIAEKQFIHATYQHRRRELCPHVIGTKNGRQQALFYQFGGSSNSGLRRNPSPENWRCMVIEEMSFVEVVASNGAWYTCDDHGEKQTCVDLNRIDLEVLY